MRQYGRQIDNPSVLVDRRCLHRGDLMLPECFPHDIKATGERRITEAAFRLPCPFARNGRGQRFLRIGEFGLRLGERRGNRSDRLTRALQGCPPPPREDRS